MRVFGVLLIATGVSALVESFARFALQGLGTPAIVFPLRHLVVKGLYRHVRNPMYLAVVAIILGEATVLGDLQLLVYCAVVWLFCHLFVLAYGLRQANYDWVKGRSETGWKPMLPWLRQRAMRGVGKVT